LKVEEESSTEDRFEILHSILTALANDPDPYDSFTIPQLAQQLKMSEAKVVFYVGPLIERGEVTAFWKNGQPHISRKKKDQTK